jgi:SAM-dependent methyltransferase
VDLKEIDILDDTISSHWYYRFKARAVARLLCKEKISTILDVGAGSGYFSRYLLSHSDAKEAWCVDISYESDSDYFEVEKPIQFRRSVNTSNADLVLLMDVLEHVDDDVGLLKEYVNKVPSGTRFLISVPAFQFLWSDHDVFLEHKRRYKLDQIELVAERAGLKVTHGSYYFGSVFPIAATIRLVENIFSKNTQDPRSQLRRHPLIVNGILSTLCKAELPLMRFNRLGGLTAFCLAKSQ